MKEKRTVKNTEDLHIADTEHALCRGRAKACPCGSGFFTFKEAVYNASGGYYWRKVTRQESKDYYREALSKAIAK